MAHVICPSCQSELEIELPAGTEFDCGACGAAMLMPDAAPPPPAAPRKIAPGPRAPAPRSGGAAPSGRAPSSGAPGRRSAPIGGGGRKAAGGGDNQKFLVLGGIGLVAIIAIVVVVKMSGGDPKAVEGSSPSYVQGGLQKPSDTTPPVNGGATDTSAGGAAASNAGGAAGASTPKKPDPKPDAGETAKPKPPPKRRPPRPNDYHDKLGALRWDMEAPDAKVGAYTTFANYTALRSAELEVEGKAAESEEMAKESRAAAEAALKIDENDLQARALLGYVRFDKTEATRLLSASWMRPYFKAEMELLIPEVAREAGSPDKAVWLSCKDGPQKDIALRWRDMTRRADRWRKTAMDPESDRFAKGAMRRYAELEKDLGERLKRAGVDGASFQVFAFKPYVLYVQKDTGGSEDRIAEKWIDLLEQVKETFFLRYRARFGLDEMEEITPVIVLQSFAEYKKYNEGKNENAAAHFEPGTGRLVTWVGAFGKENVPDDHRDASGMTVKYIRGSVFHEATHQLVHFITREVGRQRAGGQAMWFSEGIADYFGFHSRHLDPDTGRWRYKLGQVSEERIGSLRVARKNLMTLVPVSGRQHLLDYLRSDFVSDNAVLFGDADRQRKPAELARAQLRTSLAYAQGWSLTYFLNEWGDRKYRAKFEEYMMGERMGVSGPGAFAKIFGADLSEMEKEYFAMIDDFIKALDEKRIDNGVIRPK